MEGEGSCVKFLILVQDEEALLQLRREQKARCVHIYRQEEAAVGPGEDLEFL